MSREITGTRAPAAASGGTTPLLTAAQLAERWQVPVRTVYSWAKRNAIPHYRAGRLLRFDPVEVEEHFRHHDFADEVPADPEHPGESAFALLSRSSHDTLSSRPGDGRPTRAEGVTGSGVA